MLSCSQLDTCHRWTCTFYHFFPLFFLKRRWLHLIFSYLWEFTHVFLSTTHIDYFIIIPFNRRSKTCPSDVELLASRPIFICLLLRNHRSLTDKQLTSNPKKTPKLDHTLGVRLTVIHRKSEKIMSLLLTSGLNVHTYQRQSLGHIFQPIEQLWIKILRKTRWLNKIGEEKNLFSLKNYWNYFYD